MAAYLLGNKLVGDLAVDVVVSESHKSDLAITEHPVETGGNISDHAYLRPKELTLTCGVSNFPFEGAEAILNGSPSTRVSSAFQQLLALQESRIPFDVQTGLHLYTNMLVKGIDTVVDESNYNILRFVARLYEVRIVSSQAVKYPAELFRDLPPKPKRKSTATSGTSATKRNSQKKRVKKPGQRREVDAKTKAEQKRTANRGQSTTNRGSVSTPQASEAKRQSVLYRIFK